MAKKQRGSYHHGNLRESLIAEAIRLLTERGGPHFTMRELAIKLGVSHSAAYRHFADKESLLAAIAADGFTRMGKEQQAVRATKRAPWERLKGLGMAYVRFAVANPAHFRVMFGSALGDTTKYPELAKASAATFEAVVSEATECQHAGKLRKGEPRELALVLWSTVHGLAALSVDGQVERTAGFSPEEEEAFAARLAEAILRGLAP